MLWLILFFLVPLMTLARTSLSTKESRFDFEATFDWNFANFTDSMSTYSDQFIRSFVYAGIATILCILIGYPVAYVIAFRGGKYRNVLLGLVVVPFFTSFLIRTLAWTTILADEGPVLAMADRLRFTGILESIGIVQNGGLLSTSSAVIGGLTYNFLPFMILPIYVSLEKVDLRLAEAAKDLYANGWSAFRRVVLPLSLPGVFAGSLLTFIPAAGDFINAKFLGGPNNSMIGTVVQDRFLVQLDYPTAAALSFVLMVIITVAVLIYARLLGTDDLV
ncbi:MAG: ABC transporter permease [Acidimicrobiales bacterium]|nr:ABC transporter permease [Acidimicrobiales bacterium]